MLLFFTLFFGRSGKCDASHFISVSEKGALWLEKAGEKEKEIVWWNKAVKDKPRWHQRRLKENFSALWVNRLGRDESWGWRVVLNR